MTTLTGICRECGENYDTPHQPDCPQRRKHLTTKGEPRVLVKIIDLASNEPESDEEEE